MAAGATIGIPCRSNQRNWILPDTGAARSTLFFDLKQTLRERLAIDLHASDTIYDRALSDDLSYNATRASLWPKRGLALTIWISRLQPLGDHCWSHCLSAIAFSDKAQQNW